MATRRCIAWCRASPLAQTGKLRPTDVPTPRLTSHETRALAGAAILGLLHLAAGGDCPGRLDLSAAVRVQSVVQVDGCVDVGG